MTNLLTHLKYKKILEKILKESPLIVTDANSPIDNILNFEIKKKGYSKNEFNIDENPSKRILYSFYVNRKVFKNKRDKFIIQARYSVNSQRYYVAKKIN